MEIILKGSSSKQKSVGSFELPENFRKFRFLIFNSMSFINNHVAPIKFFKYRFLFNTHFIRSDTHIPFAWHENVSDKSTLKILKMLIIYHLFNQLLTKLLLQLFYLILPCTIFRLCIYNYLSNRKICNTQLNNNKYILYLKFKSYFSKYMIHKLLLTDNKRLKIGNVISDLVNIILFVNNCVESSFIRITKYLLLLLDLL